MTEPEALPEHIGPYRVTGRLGRGGMGEVLAGHDDRLDRPVALKRVHPGGRDPEKTRRRFRREARVAAQLSHPAIVPVYDWVGGEDCDWLVMELVDGKTLDAVLEDGPLPPERAAEIARQVVAGLAAAHDAGLVHRDLKPANVMVTAAGAIKILDFGIAKKVGLDAGGTGTDAGDRRTTLTEAGQVIGTVASMSPEQALGYPVDHRSDLFSLGTLLYEMLAGVSPFHGNSKVETLSRICGARETPLRDLDPGIPSGLAELVGRLLEKQPERRPASAKVVVAELDRIEPTLTTVSPVARAGSDDETLPMPATIEGAEQHQVPAESRKAWRSGTYSAPRLSRGWAGSLAAAGLLIAAGIWTLAPRLRAPVEGRVAEMAAQPSGRELNSYELYHRGMASLARFDREGNIAKAIDDFLRILANDESSAPGLAGLSKAYRLDYAEGGRNPQRLEQALTVGRQAVQTDEHLAAARNSLALAYLAGGQTEEATRELEKSLEIEPLNGEAYWGLAKVAEALGDNEQAERHFSRAIEIDPDNWLFHSHLGSFYYDRNRYKESEVAFLRHTELTPDSFLPFRNLGAASYMQGHLAEAASHFQKSLQIQPDSTVYSNLGTVQFSRGLYAQAVSAFEKAVNAGGSNDHLLWGNLGDACRWTPDQEPRAHEAYSVAIQLLKDELGRRPRDAILHSFLPMYLAKLGECDGARAEILETLEMPHEQDGAAWFRMAIAHEVCGQRDEALATLEAALQASYSFNDVLADPELSGLRQDARYQRLRMSLSTPHESR